MAQPAPDNGIISTPPETAAETAAAAKVAVKVSALPPHLEPRTGQFSVRARAKSQSPSPQRVRSRILYGLACLITLSLVAVAVLRVTWHDGTHFLIWLNAFTRYVYLPAYACLVWAVWKRRWKLVIANLAVVCFHVALLAPDVTRDRRFDLPSIGAAANVPGAPPFAYFLQTFAR
jgi:hypothetical protein